VTSGFVASLPNQSPNPSTKHGAWFMVDLGDIEAQVDAIVMTGFVDKEVNMKDVRVFASLEAEIDDVPDSDFLSESFTA